jgi:UDP-GlcNAc3NAcA epimerase
MQRAQKKIVTIVGTRPQFIKAFALSRALAAADDFEEILVHTGQHFDENMSSVFFDELAMAPPRYRFDIHGLGHGAMTARMLEAIENVLLREKPDAVAVYGDTNSTLAGALAASKLHVPLVHIEAGLRSFDRRMPEEMNRVLADHMADLLFCPTRAAVENLAREGIAKGVHTTGDLMYDTMTIATPFAEKSSTVLERLNLASGGYGVATIHRAANTDDPARLGALVDYLADEARARPIVFPVHPRTFGAAMKAGIDFARPGLVAVDPLGYLDMCRLTHHAAAVYTDSGGIQKEAYFHRVPCVTLRDETEWVETIDCGWNRLWRGPGYKPRRDIDEYGNGHSAARMLDAMRAGL